MQRTNLKIRKRAMYIAAIIVLLAYSAIMFSLPVAACNGYSHGYQSNYPGYIPQMLPPTGFVPGIGGLYSPSNTTITIIRK